MSLEVYAEAAEASLLDDLYSLLGRDPTEEESAVYCTEYRLWSRARWIAENACGDDYREDR